MPTSQEFDEREIVLLLSTLLRLRNILFDCTKLDIDKRGRPTKLKDKFIGWIGKRGTFPLLKEIDKCIAILRIHINSEEAIQLYDVMGMFDNPKNYKQKDEGPEGPPC